MESLILRDKSHIRRLTICPAGGITVPDESIPVLRFSSVTLNRKSSCLIDVVSASDLTQPELLPVISKPIYGCLGIIKVGSEDFLGLVTEVNHVGTLNHLKLFRIVSTTFISLSSSMYDPENATERGDSNPCNGLMKLFAEGSFYCAYDWDATRSIQRLLKEEKKPLSFEDFDPNFLWNGFMLGPVRAQVERSGFIKFWEHGICVISFAGFVKVLQVSLGEASASLAIISRLACKRFGTRFRSRGIDDDGNASNFIETETILALPTLTFSYLIIRGSIPVFWDQQGLQLGYPRIQFTRTPAATKPAFDRHFQILQSKYGLVHVIDLLSQKEGQVEHSLSSAFSYHAKNLESEDFLRHTHFDVYEICRGNNYSRLDTLFHLIGRDVQTFGYFVLGNSGQILKEQRGIFRVNCLDCLDRTNIVQTYIVKRTLDLFLRNFLLSSEGSYHALPLHEALSSIFSENGDQLSRMYAGSNAIKSSYGRLGKLTVTNFMEDVKNSAKRFYSSNFTEKERQITIDLLLGRLWGQDSTSVVTKSPSRSDLLSNLQSYQTLAGRPLVVQIFTWNMNATTFVTQEEFLTALMSATKNVVIPDIFVLGLQEVVSLTASQIVSADPERRVLWENSFLASLNRMHPQQNFLLLCSHQLVGVSISIFASENIVAGIRSVQFVDKKTGMGGMTGNKGSICVSMEILGLETCFLVSHLAAGQANWNERDRDMQTTIQDLQLQAGKSILSHDCIFWFGDLNYRVDIDRETALSLIRDHDFDGLLRYDQLLARITNEPSFEGLQEARIYFAPTYKYDPGTNVYDTSDKSRIPSWTDRILFRIGQKCCITPLLYDRVEIDFSDHKPVMGIFRVDFTDGASSNSDSTWNLTVCPSQPEDPYQERYFSPTSNSGAISSSS